MRERLRSRSLTPAAGGLLLVLVAAVGVLAAGPGSERGPAIVVIVIVAVTLVLRPGGNRAAWSRMREREEELHPRQGRDGGEPHARAGRGERERD